MVSQHLSPMMTSSSSNNGAVPTHTDGAVVHELHLLSHKQCRSSLNLMPTYRHLRFVKSITTIKHFHSIYILRKCAREPPSASNSRREFPTKSDSTPAQTVLRSPLFVDPVLCVLK